MIRRLLPILVGVSLVVTPALAGSPGDPEISDDRGDVDVQHLVDADILSGDDETVEDVETGADVVRAWIDEETHDSFEVNVEVADIPEDPAVSSPLVDVWTHFTVREGGYHTQATLSSPQSGSLVEADYALYLDEARTADLDGDVDVEEDVVSFRVPKADVRDPGEGDELDRFYVTTHEPASQAALDYAPGTNSKSLPSIDDADGVDPTGLDLSADARFGQAYAFADFEDSASRLSVSITPSSLEVEAGQEEEFTVRVTNDADEAEEVSLSTSSAPSGWSASVSPSSLTVPAHRSQTATLSITPADDADGHEIVDVNVAGDRGAEKAASVSIVAVHPADGASSSPTGLDYDGPVEDPSSSSSSSSSDDDGGDDASRSSDEGSAEASDGDADGANASSGAEAQDAPFLAALAIVFALAAGILTVCARG